MKIGHMNSPFFPLDEEFRFAAREGFDYLELTIEPPHSALEDLEPDAILELSRETGLDIPVTHNSWYIPYANPLPAVSRACLPYLENCLEISSRVGAGLANIHTNLSYSSKLIDRVILNHIDFLRRLVDAGRRRGVEIILEPVGSRYDTFATLSLILDEVEGLGFHLDLGHSHITESDSGAALIRRHAERLRHVHLSDNRGREDEHLPLGCGNLPLERLLGVLNEIGYDGTFTLEIFSPDRGYLLASRDTLASTWQRVTDT